MKELYPIKFDNIYYSKIWGGKDFYRFRNNVPEGDNIGESWDIAYHKGTISKVTNGFLKDRGLDEIIKIYGHKLLGKDVELNNFPLLIKLISANENLSIQVHPDDDYAKKVEDDFGKTEAWYIIDADEDACIIAGLKNCNKEQFKKAIAEKSVEKYLNKIKVKKGDFIFIKSGLVHAICKGILLLEIQQNSDITYRVYDYNRGRELHIDKAINVIDFELNTNKIECNQQVKDGKISLCNSKFFTIEKFTIDTSIRGKSNPSQFYLLTCVEGSGKIKYHENQYEKVEMGDTILIPACLGKYELIGNFTILKSCI